MTKLNTRWLAQFPELQALQDSAWQQALSQTKLATIPTGQVLYKSGDTCENFVLVLQGAIRVQIISESGNEVVLYRVEDGQSCILTTTCLVAHDRYHAEGITETEVSAVIIPAVAFQNALAHSEGFRRFVFSSYAQRLTDLLMLIDAISFGRMDVRLASTLLAMADNNREIHITHYDLARELGTAREVVSRLLKDFERRDWVRLRRGIITVHDAEALNRFASKSNAI